MKNISDILTAIGITIPEDKQDDFTKAFNENYRTVNEIEKVSTKLNALQTKYDTDIKKRDDDIVAIQTQLAQVGNDATKLQETTSALTKLQEDYEKAKKDYESNLSKQKYESLVREKTNELKFSSNSAKKAFLTDALAKGIAVQDGELVGFDKFVDSYKETDANAFITETPNEPVPTVAKPTFVAKATADPQPQPQHKEVPVVW